MLRKYIVQNSAKLGVTCRNIYEGKVFCDCAFQNSQVQSFIEYSKTAIHKILPASFGDCLCVDHHAPQPCVGNVPLDVVKTGIYEAEARWISGLKTIENLTSTLSAEKVRK